MESLAKFGKFCFIASFAGIVVYACAPPAAMADDVTVATMLAGLQRPAGVAVRPDATEVEHEIYVADAGAGRVVRVSSGRPGVGEDAITGFQHHAGRDDASDSIGPQGLLFLDHKRLVVTGGGSDGRGFVRLYELIAGKTPLRAEQSEQHLAAASDEPRAAAVNSFRGLARTLANESVADALFVVGSGEQAPVGIWKIPVRAGTLGELHPTPFTKSNEPRSSLGGIATTPQGYILVSYPKSGRDAAVNRLEFVNPIDGAVGLQLSAKSPTIVGLAYSPKTGHLYAAALGSSDAKNDGIYRIDDHGERSEPATEATRIADVSRPTALAFSPDGALYVATLGESNEVNVDGGAVLKLLGEL